MPAPVAVNEDEIVRQARVYATGTVTLDEIAQRLGIARQTVTGLFRKRGVTIYPVSHRADETFRPAGEWAEEAACVNHVRTFDAVSDPVLPRYTREDREYRARLEQTCRDVCRACPVIDLCATWVLDQRPEDVAGIVAGMTQQERADLTSRVR